MTSETVHGRRIVTIKHQIKSGSPFQNPMQESLAAPPSGKSAMTSYPAIPLKVEYIGNAWFLLNTKVKSRGRPFRIRIYESIVAHPCGDDAIASFMAKNKKTF